jgi:zinc transporter ZupT
MNQKRTRVPLPHPPPYRPSRASFWLTVVVGLLLAFTIGASIYLLVDSLINGAISTHNRTGPRHTYSLALQPRMFWFEVVWQSLVTLLLLSISVFGLWACRKAQEPADRPRRARR